jgi:GTP-binding protein
LPEDALSEVALVGRSNVGKSSLINALTRQRLARTSAAPGKTRLANVYWLQRGATGSGSAEAPFYLVDLPGDGYARAPRPGRGGPGGLEGRRHAAREFAALTEAYFGRGRLDKQLAAILLVDARHPGLALDVEAWGWLKQTVDDVAIVATKVDKLARGERIRAMRQHESVFDEPVLPVSAATGEGLDELWKLIDRLANSRNPLPPPNQRSPSKPARAMGPSGSSASSSRRSRT